MASMVWHEIRDIQYIILSKAVYWHGLGVETCSGAGASSPPGLQPGCQKCLRGI